MAVLQELLLLIHVQASYTSHSLAMLQWEAQEEDFEPNSRLFCYEVLPELHWENAVSLLHPLLCEPCIF